MGLEARIWASRLGFGPRDWDLGLEAGIWTSRLGFEGGGTEKEEKKKKEKKKGRQGQCQCLQTDAEIAESQKVENINGVLTDGVQAGGTDGRSDKAGD